MALSPARRGAFAALATPRTRGSRCMVVTRTLEEARGIESPPVSAAVSVDRDINKGGSLTSVNAGNVGR